MQPIQMVREFTDTGGMHWRVYEVTDAKRARTSGSFTRADLLSPTDWLCFESATQVRKLTPIPQDWERTDELNLEYYCARAERVASRPNAGDMRA